MNIHPKTFYKGSVNMAFALILLFILSANAWADGDDSMAWFVILGVIFVVCALLFGSCSN